MKEKIEEIIKSDNTFKILLLLNFISVIKIPLLDDLIPHVSILYFTINIITFTLLLFHIEKININGFIKYIFVYYLLLFFSTIINPDGYLKTVIYELITVSTTMILLNSLSKKQLKETLTTFVLLIEVLTYVNFVFIILFPNGLYNVGLARKFYIFGHVNNAVRYLLPCSCLTLIRSYIDNKKIDKRCIIFFIVSFLTLLFTKPVTSMMGYVIFILAIISLIHFDSIKKFLKPINSYLIAGFTTILLVVFGVQKYFSFILDKVLHKGVTLSGRTIIWERSINLIKEKILFGYGRLSIESRYSILRATSSHNQYLVLLFEGGLILLIFFTYFIFKISKKLMKCNNERIVNALMACIASYFVMWIAEPFSYSAIILMFLILYLAYNSKELFNTRKNNRGFIPQVDIKSNNNIINEIEKWMNISIEEIKEKGYISGGNNGPYFDNETSLRVSAHWVKTLSWFYYNQGNKDCLKYIKVLAKHIMKNAIYLDNGKITFCSRNKEGKDHINGVIGDAWIIEGLIEASKVLKDNKYYDLAVKVFLSHDFNQKIGMWDRYEIDGRRLGYDDTFNHQLWLAAAGAEIVGFKNNKTIRKQILIFLDKLEDDNLYRIHNDGLIKHFAIVNDTLRHRLGYIKNHMFKDYSKDRSLRYKEEGYHYFAMYGLAILKKYFPNHSVFYSEKINKSLKYTFDKNNYLRQLNNSSNNDGTKLAQKISPNSNVNIYCFPYNSPLFELPFIAREFQINDFNDKDLEELWKIQQKIMYNDLGEFADTIKDPQTLKARCYELFN